MVEQLTEDYSVLCYGRPSKFNGMIICRWLSLELGLLISIGTNRFGRSVFWEARL